MKDAESGMLFGHDHQVSGQKFSRKKPGFSLQGWAVKVTRHRIRNRVSLPPYSHKKNMSAIKKSCVQDKKSGWGRKPDFF